MKLSVLSRWQPQLIISVCAVGWAGSTVAATITVNAVAPNTDVAVQQTGSNGSSDIRRISNVGSSRRDFAQTFTAPEDADNTFDLTAISILIGQDTPYPTGGQAFVIDVFSTPSTATANGGTITNLLTETGTTPAYDSNAARWMTFDLDAAVPLTSGNFYGFRIGFNATGGTNRLGGGDNDFGGVFVNDSSSYPLGGGFRIVGNATGTGDGTVSSVGDLGFVLQASGFAAPPPPSDTAAITINDTGAAPAGSIAIQQTTSSFSSDLRRTDNTFVNNKREFIQTFTVDSEIDLDAISLLIGQASADPSGLATEGQQFSLDVFSTTNVNTHTGVSLFSEEQIATTPNYTADEQRWLRFDTEDVTLAPGTYGFKLSFTETLPENILGGANFGGVYADTTNPYPDGRAFRILGNGSSTSGYENTDWAFIIQAVVVPELSSFILSGCGLLGMLCIGLRKRGRN
jgi:hypothetical protein